MSPPDFHNKDQQSNKDKSDDLQGTMNGEPAVIHKQLGEDIIAEANKDGTIYLDESIPINSKKGKQAIRHEKVHLDQMNRGDLNYDDNYVYWKGKKYSRDNMFEGSKKLPWEKEAWSKT